jgi:hypothetical protein
MDLTTTSSQARLGIPEDYPWVLDSSNKTNPKENSPFWAPAIKEDLKNSKVIVDPDTRAYLSFYPVKSGQYVSIYNLYVPRSERSKGAGRRMVELLRKIYPDRPIYVKCPVGIKANDFYAHLGFRFQEVLPPSGRRYTPLNFWVWDVQDV